MYAIVKIAREQIAAFNSGDWERVRSGLAADSRYDELGTEPTIEGLEQIVELFQGLEACVSGRSRHLHQRRRQRRTRTEETGVDPPGVVHVRYGGCQRPVF